MDPVTTTLLVSGLGQGLVKVFEKLLEKGVLDPALERGLGGLREWVGRGYDKSQDQEKLRQALLDALDELCRDQGIDNYARLVVTLKLTDLDAAAHQALAAAAVEMTRLAPSAIPPELMEALNLSENRRELLARFLFIFRKHLKDLENYREGIVYADHLDQRGQLEGITREMAGLAARAERLVSIEEAMLADRRLTTDDQQALRDYLTELRRMLGDVPLPLARKRSIEPTSAGLKQIFVPLRLRDAQAEAEARRQMEKRNRQSRQTGEAEAAEEARTVEIGDVLARYPRFILIGPPGSGKTTLLRRVGLAFAEGRATEDLGWNGKTLFPIFLRLRNFAAFLQGRQADFTAPSHGALIAYMNHYFRNERCLKLSVNFFDQRIREGNCLILLDGLDEVSVGRSDVAQQVNSFIKYYQENGNRFGLASRPRGYDPVEIYLRGASLAVCDVLPLAPQGIRRLIANLFDLVESNPAQRLKDSQKLAQKILAGRELAEIASTPLFCTALVQVYKYHGADLPQRRVDVFQEIVDLLLGFWKAQDDDLIKAGELAMEDGTGTVFREVRDAVEVKKGRLCRLAYQMQQDRQAEITRDKAVNLLREHLRERERVKNVELAKEWSQNFLLNSHDRSGLLVELEPDVYAFVHQFFREYLAATALINRREAEFIQEILDYIENDWWEQVILLAAAHADLPNAWRDYLINEVLDRAESLKAQGKTEPWLHHLLTAGHAARDMAGRLPAGEHERVEQTLHAAMTDPDLPAKLRASAADALDGLGWLPPDLYEFVMISPLKSMSPVPDPFWIAKHPVTNLQYARFLEADDFADPALWRGIPKFDEKSRPMQGDWGAEGWQWLQKVQEDRENSPDGVHVYPRYWNDPRFGFACRAVPVVGITWYEANAYCRWLLKHWDELEEGRTQPNWLPALVRLPTEAEWVAAAGGAQPPERFPWDAPGEATDNDAEILRRANVDESGILRTTPVGMYLLGRSQPYGLWDLAGNVWEWQASHVDKDHDWLALRGGSWYDDPRFARLSARFNNHPYGYWYLVGFRVVALPS